VYWSYSLRRNCFKAVLVGLHRISLVLQSDQCQDILFEIVCDRALGAKRLHRKKHVHKYNEIGGNEVDSISNIVILDPATPCPFDTGKPEF
jgi:hypothetical protein